MQSKSQVLLLPGETERYKCSPRASLKSPSTGFCLQSHHAWPVLVPVLPYPLKVSLVTTHLHRKLNSAVPLGNQKADV